MAKKVTKDGTSVATRPGLLALLVLIGFGLFYAYDLFEAISNLVGVSTQLAAYNEFYAGTGLEEKSVPWALLGANTALPVVAYALAWLLGRRRGILYRCLFFVLGLAVVAALTLTLTALV